MTRRQVSSIEEIESLLIEDSPLRLLLVRRGTTTPRTSAAVQRAKELRLKVRAASANDLRRMSACEPPAEILGLVGPDPAADRKSMFVQGGAVWLIVGVAYPGNAGFMIRTAEVSGADGIVIDTDLIGRGRQRALRAAMSADRFFPVRWESAETTLRAAKEARKRMLAIEDCGKSMP
jgi:tRNA G18 (ribose-2'-O)-methylase SpoU